MRLQSKIGRLYLQQNSLYESVSMSCLYFDVN